MTNATTTTRFTPTSITTAEPGWRAVVQLSDEVARTVQTEEGALIARVVLWAVVRIEAVDENGAVVEDLGTGVEAMIPWKDGAGLQLVCAQDLGRARYLAPGSGEPA